MSHKLKSFLSTTFRSEPSPFFLEVLLLIASLPLFVPPSSGADPVKATQFPWINTFSVEYMPEDSTTYATQNIEHFDIHLSENYDGIQASNPNAVTVIYRLWESQVATEMEPYTTDRTKMQRWADANGKNLEDFYLHYNEDTYTTSAGHDLIIPGWDSANDANGDGARDYPSDWGLAAVTGSSFLEDATKTWTPNAWTNAALIDKAGSSFRVISNTATRLNLESGTPVSGRYGLSAQGSVNNKATARTRIDSRVKMFVWLNFNYVMNVGNPDYRAYRSYDAQQLLLGNKSWDPIASTSLDGFMIDTFMPIMAQPQVLDGPGRVTEYATTQAYVSDLAGLLSAVRSVIGTNKFIFPNSGNYLFESAALAGGGNFLENMVAPSIAHGSFIWDYWKQLSDQQTYAIPYFRFDVADPNRHRLHSLAYYYIGKQPYVYFAVNGFAPGQPGTWFPAMGVDVGTPLDPGYVTVESGQRKDGAGQPVYIYTRRYTKALMVSRPREGWNHYDLSENSAVVFDLPSYTNGAGKQSNLWQPLKVDGAFDAAVSRVSLRNAEGAILFPLTDDAAPVGSIKINKNAKTTRSPKVTLSLAVSGSPSGLRMRFSNNGKKWTRWRTYAGRFKNWSLVKAAYGGNSRKGRKYVYAQFRESHGNISRRCRDAIRLL